MKFHGQNLESLYKDVPMRLLPVEYLPDDYKGPNAGTEKEIIGNDNRTTFFIIILPTALAREVIKSPLSACLLSLYFRNRLTVDFELLHASRS